MEITTGEAIGVFSLLFGMLGGLIGWIRQDLLGRVHGIEEHQKDFVSGEICAIKNGVLVEKMEKLEDAVNQNGQQTVKLIQELINKIS